MISIEIITPEGRMQIELQAGYDLQGVVEIRRCKYCDRPFIVNNHNHQSCSDTHRKAFDKKNRE